MRTYREAMAEFAQMRTMDLWYAHLSEDDLRAAVGKVAAAAEQHKAGKSGKSSKPSKTTPVVLG